jgi:hypothetical protein
MARTATVTKKSVDCIGGEEGKRKYNITLNLQYKDEATVLIDQDFPLEYVQGENPGIYAARWGHQMQKAINDYKAEESIFNASQLNAAVTNIQNALGV